MFTSYRKREIRHFYVVVVQWRKKEIRRNVQKWWCTCKVVSFLPIYTQCFFAVLSWRRRLRCPVLPLKVSLAVMRELKKYLLTDTVQPYCAGACATPKLVSFKGFNCREPGKTGDDLSLPRSISLAARPNRSTTRRDQIWIVMLHFLEFLYSCVAIRRLFSQATGTPVLIPIFSTNIPDSFIWEP